ncbi:MAG: cyclodeaminase/cyclohydrolase family protein [Nocardiopsaceae bacterium]|jgi:formiminotetrahydrofolate cyclodeaminase|nr:cyclodeaminase/cyclohydrolase family protein [Nocardiopsaceae bacterium]
MPDGYGGLQVSAFLDALASRAPAPAGGSAAALVLAQAAALCAKSARLSARQLTAGRAGQMTDEAEHIRATAASLIDEDPRAYAAVLTALRHRAEQPEGSAEAAAALATALSAAADVPLRIVELAVPVSAMAATLAADGNKALKGDALTAGLLAQAAAKAAATLLRINLAAETDDVRHAQVDTLLTRVEKHLR